MCFTGLFSAQVGLCVNWFDTDAVWPLRFLALLWWHLRLNGFCWLKLKALQFWTMQCTQDIVFAFWLKFFWFCAHIMRHYPQEKSSVRTVLPLFWLSVPDWIRNETMKMRRNSPLSFSVLFKTWMCKKGNLRQVSVETGPVFVHWSCKVRIAMLSFSY